MIDLVLFSPLFTKVHSKLSKSQFPDSGESSNFYQVHVNKSVREVEFSFITMLESYQHTSIAPTSSFHLLSLLRWFSLILSYTCLFQPVLHRFISYEMYQFEMFEYFLKSRKMSTPIYVSLKQMEYVFKKVTLILKTNLKKGKMLS